MKDLTVFKNIILQADPKATKFKGDNRNNDNYTVWSPYRIDKEMSDNTEEDIVYRIQVDRFTKIDNDPIAKLIYAKLTEYGIPFEYQIDFEDDTQYIHHIYDCLF